MTRIAVFLLITCGFTIPAHADGDGADAWRAYLEDISERIAELTAAIDTALIDENSAQDIYDEQVSIIRDEIHTVVDFDAMPPSQRARFYAAIRALEDEQEVAVMLARADALDVAIDQAKQRLEQVRELAGAAVALASRVEDLSGGVPFD